jgi:hypothetical protein
MIILAPPSEIGPMVIQDEISREAAVLMGANSQLIKTVAGALAVP